MGVVRVVFTPHIFTLEYQNRIVCMKKNEKFDMSTYRYQKIDVPLSAEIENWFLCSQQVKDRGRISIWNNKWIGNWFSKPSQPRRSDQDESEDEILD